MDKTIMDVIRARRSVREFSPDPVSDDTITKLLEAAILAPSGGNRQPWFFYVVKGGKTRAALAEAALGQAFLKTAPVNIVVCAEPETSGQRYGNRGAELYCLQDTAAAIQNILLAAKGLGLGTCWVGAFDEGLVSKALDIPGTRRPVAIIPIGYSAEESKEQEPVRRALKEVTHWVE